MPEETSGAHPTLALNTKLEEDFVSPLTAIRGSLEILRDYSDLAEEERQRFIETALRGCARLEQGVDHLATTVYAAGERTRPIKSASLPPAKYREYASRIHLLEDTDVVELDFSNFEFSSSQIVNDFFNVIDQVMETTGRSWYCLMNCAGHSVWPEAWVAFAHRGKKFNVAHSLGTVRFATRETSGDRFAAGSHSGRYDENLFDSRDLALAKIEEMKAAGAH